MDPWKFMASIIGCMLLSFNTNGTEKSSDRLLGAKPPEWRFTDWMNSEPLTFSALRGKVVLVRWWTAPQCPYCRNTAPALNQFHADYAKRGLTVIGAYHHKSPDPLEPDHVRKYAGDYNFQFPVAIDRGWRTLHEWWLDRGETKWTSVTFLMDRQGRVRHIHPGGEYVRGDTDHAALKSRIEELLAEE
jgi:peroxiredoxin